jgi:hypothetical protein
MLGRRATVTVTGLTLTVCGGAIALAATHGGGSTHAGSSKRPAQHATTRERLQYLDITQHMPAHLCHPGLRGSKVDALTN